MARVMVGFSQGQCIAGVVAISLLVACDRGAPRSSPASHLEATPAGDTTGAPDTSLLLGLSRLSPTSLPSDLLALCDSAAAIVKSALGSAPRREDGTFTDSFRGDARVGCRLTYVERSKAPDSAVQGRPLDREFELHGWATDLRYMADGPDASDYGMRRRDALCLISDRHGGHEHEDSTSTATTEDESAMIVECMRDVSSNRDAGVPDSIWRVAAAVGTDSLYAIDFRLQYPPYLDGDFDGDGVSDAAVLVTERRTGKLGVMFVLVGSRKVVVAGAGSPAKNGSDDLSGIERWDVLPRLSTIHPFIPGQPSAPLRGDALWVSRRDSTSAGFLLLRGSEIQWDAGRR